ncbi:MAG TPA: histidine--tRNA ligase [Candidatus Baltobacteraceae bacterium]|jgi:histidyl-tRNA synthetase|nr:histidine--tRNA ligase [Candidatus Baltobacteraceae bacterium]
MSSKLTAPRGTQDIVPPQSARWHALETRIHALATRFGYTEIRTPTFEATELFVRGVGETTDIVEKEMYTFLDKGERSITLRPEWTAPVVRAALEHNLFAHGPQRLYYIGPIYRYERPQKGRYRQSHQFGVECTGYTGPEADLEVIALAWELVRSYGIDDAVLNVNSIGDDACRPLYRDALLAHFRPHLSELSADSQRRLERNPLRLLDSKDEKDRPFVDSAPTFESVLCDACREHFDALKAYLDEIGIPYVVNPRIVRGLDYYTRTVFEIVSSALGAQSTVCGGGRYDDLVKSLGGPDVPAVGFGLGLERFLMMLEALKGAAAPPRSGVQAIALGPQARTVLVALVMKWRRTLGIPVFMDFDDRKIGPQFKIADRNNARYAAILGSDELAAGEIVLRDLETRSERRVPMDHAAELAAALGEAQF